MFWGIVQEGLTIVFGSILKAFLSVIRSLFVKSPEATIQELKDINEQQEQTIQEVRNAQIVKQNNSNLSHDELIKWVQNEQSHRP